MDHLQVIDLPERLSLMTRFFPCFRLMFRRYLWTTAGIWTSGPAVITCCGEPFTFIGCLIPDVWFTSVGTAVQWVLTEFSKGPIIFSSKNSHGSLDIYTEKGCNDILWNIRMQTLSTVQSSWDVGLCTALWSTWYLFILKTGFYPFQHSQSTGLARHKVWFGLSDGSCEKKLKLTFDKFQSKLLLKQFYFCEIKKKCCLNM